MIRALIIRARAAVSSPAAQVAIAGMLLKVGMDMLVNVVTEMRDEITTMQQQLAEARMETAAMAGVMYPSPDDLDPLGRGTDSPIGDRLAEEYDPT